MKRCFVLLSILLPASNYLFAQKSNPLSDTKDLVMFGVDFSKAKLIGTSNDFSDINKITSYYFKEWNEIFIKEQDKYNVGKFFKIPNVKLDLTEAINRSIQNNSEDIVTLNANSISRDELPSIISNYNTDTDIKTGLLLIVESLDKPKGTVTAWVTFFDIKTKNILLAKKVSGPVGGFGFRNYWIRGIYNILIKSKSEYRKWLKGN